MEKITVEKVNEILRAVYNNTELDVQAQMTDYRIQEIIEESNDYTDLADNLKEELEQSDDLFNIEIIYYSKAMEYLSNNDASLNDSMALADELGYEVKNINSELLASLLASQNAREVFNDHWDNVVSELETLAFEAVK